MSSFYGDALKLSIFGQSHGPAIGMVLDGIPAGLPVNEQELNAFLQRRAPGQAAWATPRKEDDRPEFISGVINGHTCGAPLCAQIKNNNTRSSDYTQLKNQPRPGHADLTAQLKYGGYQDAAGGGHFSGRLTAPMCIAGGLCKQWLALRGIQLSAHIYAIGNVCDAAFDPCAPALSRVVPGFSVLDAEAGQKMQQLIEAARCEGDSVGGLIECAVTGLPAGLGEPMFGGMESKLASILYAIPAVKSVAFGAGEAFCAMKGSEANDAYVINDGKVCTATNHCGGLLGGITNGMPLLFRVGIKPTPSIARTQQTVDLASCTETSLQISGRHDPCIVPRAVAVVEAAAAIAIYDAILMNTNGR